MKFIITILALASTVLGAPFPQSSSIVTENMISTITSEPGERPQRQSDKPDPVWEPTPTMLPDFAPLPAPLPSPTYAPLPPPSSNIPSGAASGSCIPAQYDCLQDLSGWQVCQTWGEWVVSTTDTPETIHLLILHDSSLVRVPLVTGAKCFQALVQNVSDIQNRSIWNSV
jgi:hypothetical protein